MNANEINQLKEAGFKGFKTVKSLNSSMDEIPHSNGVYVVLRKMESDIPEFMEHGTGPEYHKSKPLNYDVSKLISKWVKDTSIMYIGKTDDTLYTRLTTYLKYGRGNDVAHRGGRAIWQLPDSEDLVIAWKELPANVSAGDLEKEMIRKFKITHNMNLPFANMRS